MPEAAHDAAARDIDTALQAGALRPRLGRRFDLGQVADAHAAQDDGSAGGKILVDVAPEKGPERLERGAPFNRADPHTFYGGDERGYTDFAALDKLLG